MADCLLCRKCNVQFDFLCITIALFSYVSDFDAYKHYTAHSIAIYIKV